MKEPRYFKRLHGNYNRKSNTFQDIYIPLKYTARFTMM